jgi:hypothetical protein
MLDELDLLGFFRFIAKDPVAMAKMLAPQGVVVRASDIVAFNDFALLVDARDGYEGCPGVSGFGF